MRRSLCILALSTLLHACAQGGGACDATGCRYEVEGTLRARGAQWERPADATCSAPVAGTSFAYATHVFRNDGPARTYEVHLEGAPSDPLLTLRDPFVFVYLGRRIPPDVTQCLGADDDGGTGLSSMALVDVPDGASITVVATTYGTGDAGTYRVRVLPFAG